MSNKSIQEWKITDLKGVGDVELVLDANKRVFVFFGSNGVGKTKTLEALFFFTLATVHNFESKINFQYQDKIASTISYQKESLLFEDAKGGSAYSDLVFLSRLLTQINIKKFDAIAYLGAKQRSFAEKIPSHHSKSIGGLATRQKTYFGLIESAITEDKLSELGMNQDIHHWFIERAQSVNPYQKSEDNRQVDIDTVLGALNTLDDRIGKTLNVDGDDNVYLTIEGQEIELNELSSGFISVVKIIQAIVSAYSAFTNEQNLLHVKGVVLIDEIESHLHVEWQTRIIPTLKELFPNTVFYIATHSPLVLSQLDEGEAYLLKRGDDNVVRTQVIDSPNKRILANVLRDAFGIDLNELKRESMKDSDQSLAKSRLLQLIRDPIGAAGE